MKKKEEDAEDTGRAPGTELRGIDIQQEADAEHGQDGGDIQGVIQGQPQEFQIPRHELEEEVVTDIPRREMGKLCGKVIPQREGADESYMYGKIAEDGIAHVELSIADVKAAVEQKR